LLALLRPNSKPSGICEDVAFGSIAPFRPSARHFRSTQSMDIDCVRYMPIARAAPRVRSSVTPRVNRPRSLITTVTDLPFRGFVTVTRDPKGSVRCATRQVRRPMSELGHTCPVIGWTGSSPPPRDGLQGLHRSTRRSICGLSPLAAAGSGSILARWLSAPPI
jgi:hypothetical protein